MKRWVLLPLLAMLTCCTKAEPLRIGFIAGTSGRVADLGVGGRNGAMLAVEQANEGGGINGHRVELLIRDADRATFVTLVTGGAYRTVE